MAQMQQLLNSMTPEQRAQLQELPNSCSTTWTCAGRSTSSARTCATASRRWVGTASTLPRRRSARARRGGVARPGLGDIDPLENLLRNATSPGPLAEVDLDQVRELLGDDAADASTASRELAKKLEEAGLIEQREGRMELTPRASAASVNALSATCSSGSLQDRTGRHEIERTGVGHERADEHKPYEFGDPFHLDVGRTIRNAITRRARARPCSSRPTTSRSSAPSS